MTFLDMLFQLFNRKKRTVRVSLSGESVAQSVLPNPNLPSLPESAVGPVRNTEYDNIPILPNTSHAKLMAFIEQEKTMVYRYIYRQLRDAIRNERDEAPLFRLGESALVFIKKEDYQKFLLELTTHFIAAEEYEMVPQCQKLNNELIVNRVIDETRQR